jgi:hypothetical protein
MYDEGMWPEYANPGYFMPPVIEVKVGGGTSGEYFFPVAITKFEGKKLYLGGYKHKKTARIYHHAGTQTPTEVKKIKDLGHLRTRDTQTYEVRSVSMATYRESGTQMQRVDLNINEARDRVMESREYFTSDQLLGKKKAMSVEIQRYWRGYMARCRAIQKREFIEEWERNQDEETIRALEALRETKALQLERRRNPKSNADFSGLYNELETWRKDQVVKIKAETGKGDERRLAMVEVLSEETKALQAIQKLKVAAYKESFESKTQQMLELMAQPQRWQMSDGNTAAVQTPETTRAAQLYEHYVALKDEQFTVDSRLNTLLAIKWCVKDHPCALTREISDLVDREADLLGRGRSFTSMASLRKRIKANFLQYIENPAYNPRASDFITELPKPPRFVPV